MQRYAKLEAMRLLRRLWWAIALPPAALLIAGCFDPRYLYLLLMAVFIVYPMALTFAWLSLCAKPAMIWCTRPQTQSPMPDGGRRVHFFAFPDADGNPGECLATVILSPEAIAEATIQGQYLLVSLPPDSQLSIPHLLIPKEENEQTGPENNN